MLDKKIGEGRTAEIFALDDGKVAKVFRNHIPDHFIDYELRISQRVQELNLNVPRVYGIEKMDGRNVIVYEKIVGVTALATLAKKPWKVKEIAETLARLHFEIHSKTGEGLPLFKESLKRNLKQVQVLTDQEKEKIMTHLEGLPDGSGLCHGDFHPDNVLYTSKGAVIIDWTTAASGHPLADVARTVITLQYAALPNEIPKPVKFLFQKIRPLLYKNYLKTYMDLSKSSMEEIEKWKLPVMAARLDEHLPTEEKEVLLSQIHMSAQFKN